MGAWMWYAVVLSTVLSAAALLLEVAAVRLRRPIRWGWFTAIVASLLVPAAVLLLPRQELRSHGVIGELTVTPVDIISAPVSATGVSSLPLGWLWVAASSSLLIFMLISWLHLQREKRKWPRDVVDGVAILTAPTYGPAVLGMLKPQIVLPAWVADLSPKQQALVVKHEREHIRARDQLLLGFSALAVVTTPWNPAVLLQAWRLRFALEVDCDARVLRGEQTASEYASLLVDVGARHAAPSYAMTLAEPRSALERRVRSILSDRPTSKSLATTCLAAAMLLVISAWTIPTPPTVWPAPVMEEPSSSVLSVSDTPPSKEGAAKLRSVTYKSGMVSTTMVVDTPYNRAPRIMNADVLNTGVQRHYPPLLRDAGIGGVVVMEISVRTAGAAEKISIQSSSGNEALDQAALAIGRSLMFEPARDAGGKPVPSALFLALHFDAAARPRVPSGGDGAPPAATADIRPEGGPAFTPYTVKPELKNRAAIGSALARAYPPLLRDAGIGGTVLGWVFVNAAGVVEHAQVKTSSGRAELDSAGISVMRQMLFTPAENKGKPIPVWIQLPVVFKTQ